MSDDTAPDGGTQHPERTDASHIARTAGDALSVRRVFGEAYTRGDALIIPVAKVCGGSGAGWGWGEGTAAGPAERGEADGVGGGGGGGFGVRVRPVGVYVVDDAGTRWHPTFDLNRVILGGQVLGLVAVLAAGWVLGRRRWSSPS